ncbi:MAG: GNAT family N-acetyltransferase [Spirochaetes bacterium]|nr:GNAT family N-acetyltransferase [Spirochaetota bacterium]
MKPEYVRLDRADRDEIIAVLADSFADDPAPVYFMGPRCTSSQLRRFFAFIVDQALLLDDRLEGVRIDGQLVACSLLEQPDRFRQAGIGNLVMLFVKATIAAAGFPSGSLRRMNTYFRLARAGLPAGRWHYLTMIGVRKQYQGRGLGAGLLKLLLAAVAEDAESAGLALDTENINNVAWYEKQGFELLQSVQLSTGRQEAKLRVYCMALRNARPAPAVGEAEL